MHAANEVVCKPFSLSVAVHVVSFTRTHACKHTHLHQFTVVPEKRYTDTGGKSMGSRGLVRRIDCSRF